MKQIYMLSFLCVLLFSNHAFSQFKYHDALDFDGYDDRVSIPPNDAFDFATGTVEAWVQPKLLSGANMIVLGNRGMDGTRYSIHMNANTIGLWNDDSYLTVQLSTPFRVGAWYHVAAAIHEDSTEFYVDGEKVGSTPNGMGTMTGLPIQIGNTYDGLQYKETFNGTIDEVKFWNGIRTAEEIAADMYDTTSTGASLVAYYKLDETSGTTASDATGNGNTGTLYDFALTGDRSNWVRDYTIGTPVATDASNIAPTSFTANWEAPADDTVTSYLLDVATDLYFTNPLPGYDDLDVGKVLSYSVTGLGYSQDYYYRVRVVKAGVSNPGPYSNTIMTTTLARAPKFFVNAAATSGLKDGSSWQNAFLKPEDALAVAATGDTIWVAKGTYKPGAYESFSLASGVSMYGGFAGNEESLSQRMLSAATETILQGNGSHVFDNENISQAELDGFTIYKGQYGAGVGLPGDPGDQVDFLGAGMYNYKSTAVIRNCIFSANAANTPAVLGKSLGGALYNESSTMQFISCIFLNNKGSDGGVAANTQGSDITMINCVFSGNKAANKGGAIFDSSASKSTLSGCVFYNNMTSSGEGSIVYNYASSSYLTNCTITKNYNITSGNDWLIASHNASTVSLSNNIVSGNANGILGNDNSSYYSNNNLTDIELYGANISGNPMFLDTTQPAGADGTWGTGDDGLQLQAGSDAINNGSNLDVPVYLTTDVSGNARIQNEIVDIGSYESAFATLPVTLTSFKATGNGCNVQVNWKAAQETNISKYTVEKSVDGIHFTPVADAKAKNVSGASYAYSYSSNNESTLYFRLQITDRSGKTDYSSIEQVSLSCQQVHIAMTPNPVKNVLQVSNLSGTSYIQVYNTSGQQVISVKTSNSNQPVDMTALPTGIYVVRVMNNNKLVATQKVMKQ